MTKPNRAAEFLANMTADLSPPADVQPSVSLAPKRKSAKSKGSRAGLKHIGGYFGLETVEKVAVLRARLHRDNSELIELAIDELYRKHMAKRAFGDA